MAVDTDTAEAVVAEVELAEFISELIFRVEARKNWECDRYVLDRAYWPEHPTMGLVAEMVDNA